MVSKIKIIKTVINIFAVIILFLFAFNISIPADGPNSRSTDQNSIQKNSSFFLSKNDISYNTKNDSTIHKVKTNDEGKSNVLEQEILSRAKAMTEVEWIPDHNLIDKKSSYIFIKGKTYHGVPYSMGAYQVSSPKNFLSKINNSKIIYGNDCSGLVSAAWGITRQTTLSLYNDVKNGNKIGGKRVLQISWDDLKPADALLLDNGKGKGHIMLFINSDKKNSDTLSVYEQNIPTVIPYEPIPVARRDERSKSKLIKKGYIPIRLM